MRLIGLMGFVLAVAPVPSAAAVLLRVPPAQPVCYSDLPGCGASVIAPKPARATAFGGSAALSDPAIAAIVGLAALGLALGRRRTGLAQVSS